MNVSTLDSKQLYIAVGHLSSLVTWESDWIHFGTEGEVKYKLIDEFVDKFLIDESLILICGRQNSGRYNRTEIGDCIQKLLGQESFKLWNESLTRVIDFNSIGVLRLGRK